MRQGSDESGFSVETNAVGVRVRAWGFWDAATAANFAPAVFGALRGGMTRRPQLLIDATQLKPQRDEGQQAIRDLVESASKLGVARAEFVVTNAITKMQVSRILRELNVSGWSLTSDLPSQLGGD